MEYLGHFLSEARRVHKEVCLEIMLEASKIKIGGTHGGYLVIDYKRLGVHHPGVIKVYLYARTQTLGNIGERCVLQQARVGAPRHHYTHIHTRQSCRLQSLEQTFGRQKVWCLDVHAMARIGYGFMEHHCDITPLRRRAGSDKLDTHISGRRVVLLHTVVQQRLSHKVPVHGKRILQRGHGWTDKPQMRVAPTVKIFASGNIAVGDVHPAYVPYFTINNAYFAVVAPIDARTEGWKRDLEKRVHFYPSSTHTLEVATMSVQRPHIVVYDMHGHTGTRTLLFQRFEVQGGRPQHQVCRIAELCA